MAPCTAGAQSGTNSPYSQYGLGILSDYSQGQSRGMGGTGIGLRSGDHVNTLNPASLSSIDSLTMIIDAGISGQVTNFKEGGRRLNANNSSFEYFVASFRLMPRMGVGVGLLPFTNVGYNYHTTSKINAESTTTTTGTFSGDGGVHQAYLGLGYDFGGGFSLGVSGAYLWGSSDRTVSIVSSDAYVRTMTRTYSTNVMSYKLDFGLQWTADVNKRNRLTLGATYGLGHNIGGSPEMTTTYVDPQTSVTSTSTVKAPEGLKLPHSYGAGFSWNHNNRILVAADYTFQQWGSLHYPVADNNSAAYVMGSNQLSDRHKVSAGMEWTPNRQSRHFLDRVNYRLGASFNTPYFKVNGQNGPKEYCLTAGFGIPISNAWNNRSRLNISGSWGHTSAPGLITENVFKINIGLTFNENWFMKWKVN